MKDQPNLSRPLKRVAPSPATDAGVKSASRVMQILEYFDQVQSDARAKEIVEHLGFPQSSTSALLKCLVQTGYLDYLPDSRSYIPTPRLALLGSWVGGSPMRDGSIGRMMDELSAATGETIVLAAASGIYAKYIHIVQATNPMRLHIPLGSQRLLAWSAMGVALLSGETDEAIQLLVKRTNAEMSSSQKSIDYRQVIEHITYFRKSGYFFSRGLVTPGAGLIAMRLPANSANSNRALAIGIAGLLEPLERQESNFVQLMRVTIPKYIDHSNKDSRR